MLRNAAGLCDRAYDPPVVTVKVGACHLPLHRMPGKVIVVP